VSDHNRSASKRTASLTNPLQVTLSQIAVFLNDASVRYCGVETKNEAATHSSNGSNRAFNGNPYLIAFMISHFLWPFSNRVFADRFIDPQTRSTTSSVALPAWLDMNSFAAL
jgi:hypothetical protein